MHPILSCSYPLISRDKPYLPQVISVYFLLSFSNLLQKPSRGSLGITYMARDFYNEYLKTISFQKEYVNFEESVIFSSCKNSENIKKNLT